LLGKFRNGKSPVLLATSGSKRSETWHKEVKPREWNHVDSEFPKIGVKLTREPEAGSDTRHSGGNEMVQVTVGRGSKFQSPEADVVKGFVVDAVSFVSVFDKLVD
jgi:hypothetical protein